ncbi:MAG: hypothetical protein JOZ71_02725 [Ktedonobacteraceae bacterium]|nr:hypothetical protein [Ktedonobacteraceae bacterium]
MLDNQRWEVRTGTCGRTEMSLLPSQASPSSGRLTGQVHDPATCTKASITLDA